MVCKSFPLIWNIDYGRHYWTLESNNIYTAVGKSLGEQNRSCLTILTLERLRSELALPTHINLFKTMVEGAIDYTLIGFYPCITRLKLKIRA